MTTPGAFSSPGLSDKSKSNRSSPTGVEDFDSPSPSPSRAKECDGEKVKEEPLANVPAGDICSFEDDGIITQTLPTDGNRTNSEVPIAAEVPIAVVATFLFGFISVFSLFAFLFFTPSTTFFAPIASPRESLQRNDTFLRVLPPLKAQRSTARSPMPHSSKARQSKKNKNFNTLFGFGLFGHDHHPESFESLNSSRADGLKVVVEQSSVHYFEEYEDEGEEEGATLSLAGTTLELEPTDDAAKLDAAI